MLEREKMGYPDRTDKCTKTEVCKIYGLKGVDPIWLERMV